MTPREPREARRGSRRAERSCPISVGEREVSGYTEEEEQVETVYQIAELSKTLGFVSMTRDRRNFYIQNLTTVKRTKINAGNDSPLGGFPQAGVSTQGARQTRGHRCEGRASRRGEQLGRVGGDPRPDDAEGGEPRRRRGGAPPQSDTLALLGLVRRTIRGMPTAHFDELLSTERGS